MRVACLAYVPMLRGEWVFKALSSSLPVVNQTVWVVDTRAELGSCLDVLEILISSKSFAPI